MLTPGMKARDKITGFEGVATAIKLEFDRTLHYRLEAASHDGKFGERKWFDAGRIEVIRTEADAAPKGGQRKTTQAKSESKHPSLSPLLALAMASLGIVKVEPCDDLDCPTCSIVRERGDTPQH